MQVEHPNAGDGPGVAPAMVDVEGERVDVADDGTFEVESEGWLQRFADRHDTTAEALRVDSDEETAEQEGEPDEDATPDDQPEVPDDPAGSGTLPFSPEEHTVDEVRDRVADVDDVETLRALRNLEAEQKDRTTALDALDARLNDLEE